MKRTMSVSKPRSKPDEWKFEVIQVEPKHSDQWRRFDLENWLAELLVDYYFKHKEEMDQGIIDEAKEKSQST